MWLDLTLGLGVSESPSPDVAVLWASDDQLLGLGKEEREIKSSKQR
jgi:hypothetical protein